MVFYKKMLFLICFCLPLFAFSQVEETPLPKAILVNFEFGFNMPGGDYSNRFGNNLGAGGGVEYMTENGNLVFGLQSTFYFGDEVKEDVLSNIRNGDGFLIGNNKIYADIALRQRALFVGGSIGKIFPFSQYNRRSGIRTTLGVGYFKHKIRIQEDPNSFVPIISGDYKKGWDRLSGGLALREFIGYQNLSPNGLINFYAGIELLQAFTENRREQDFNLMTKLDEKRIDLMFGVKVGWTLPFHIGVDADTIYY